MLEEAELRAAVKRAEFAEAQRLKRERDEQTFHAQDPSARAALLEEEAAEARQAMQEDAVSAPSGEHGELHTGWHSRGTSMTEEVEEDEEVQQAKEQKESGEDGPGAAVTTTKKTNEASTSQKEEEREHHNKGGDDDKDVGDDDDDDDDDHGDDDDDDDDDGTAGTDNDGDDNKGSTTKAASVTTRDAPLAQQEERKLVLPNGIGIDIKTDSKKASLRGQDGGALSHGAGAQSTNKSVGISFAEHVKQADNAQVEASCHTAQYGERCYKEVTWAMREGIKHHPEWYAPELTPHSTFRDFQEWMRKKGQGECEAPCGEPCLCVFDVDRTLTTAQDEEASCPGTAKVPGVEDRAFGGGVLVLSNLVQHISDTFCGQCYISVVSSGVVGGERSDMRGILMQMLGGVAATLGGKWSSADKVDSLLVHSAEDGHKPGAVRSVLDWIHSTEGFRVPDDRVHVFDDDQVNIPPFVSSGFNAVQVSCESRDDGGSIGLCGATVNEVVDHRGLKMCHATAESATMQLQQ